MRRLTWIFLAAWLTVAGVRAAPPPPYRFLLVINDQWPDPASEVIEGPGEFSMLCALLKSWGVPFDIHRLDQQRFDAYHLLDRDGRPLHSTIIWNAPGIRFDEPAAALVRTLVREHGVGLVALGDSVQTPVISELTGVTPNGSYETADAITLNTPHFVTRGVTLEHGPRVVSKLLRNTWSAADKPRVRGNVVALAAPTLALASRGGHPWLTARSAPSGGRVVWLDAERTTAQVFRQSVRDLLKRALVWANGYLVYADYDRSVMLSMDDMGAADKTFYPGWHYPTLSEETIRAHIIEPLRQHHAVIVQNVVTGFVDRKSHRVVNPWRQQVADELDAAAVHDFGSTKRGLDAGVQAGVFEIQAHGWTHFIPDLDSPPGPMWSAPPTGPVVQLNWYKEFGDYIRKAEIPASVQRVHLQRAIDSLAEDFGVRPLALVCGGGLSSHSAANNTLRLAAKMGFGFAQPEGSAYLGLDLCIVLEPILPRLQWQYTERLPGVEIPWTVDAPIFLGMHDRDVAMDPESFARLLDGLGDGVRFMTFAEYCGYLHARVRRVGPAEGLAFAFDYTPDYGAFFATHASRWVLHVADETRTELKLSQEKRMLEIPPGESHKVIRISDLGAGQPTTQIRLERDAGKILAMPQEFRPPYLAPTTSPVFRTTIMRIADDPGKPIAGIGTWGRDVRHNYPKNQAWNSDGTLLALENRGGKPGMLLLDGETYQPKGAIPERATRGRWHPSREHARERIAFNGTMLEWLDIVTNQPTRSWELPFKARGFTEGNPSNDGRYVAAFDDTHMCVIDMDPQPPLKTYAEGNRRIGPLVAHGGIGFNDNVNDVRYIDWISVSAGGKYVIVHHAGDHPRVWTIDPDTLALTPRPNSHQYPGMIGSAGDGFIYEVGHADLTTNPFDNNEDVIVGQEHGRNIGKVVDGKRIGGVIMVRLRDNTITPLTDPENEAYPSHASARATDRPGWVYVDYYHQRADRRFAGEIVAVKMDGSFAVERLAYEHSSHDFYRAESHVLPSRDGLRVLFASNWALKGDGEHDVIQGYVVDTRSPATANRGKK